MPKRKKTDIIQLKVRLTEELRKRLEIAAKNDERSLNSEITARLGRSFQTDELIWNIFASKDLPPELKSPVQKWIHARVVALPQAPSAEPYEDEFHPRELSPFPLEEMWRPTEEPSPAWIATQAIQAELRAQIAAAPIQESDEARRVLYDRARSGLIAQLHSIDPSLSVAEITRERQALEDAIRKVEADSVRKARTEPRPDPVAPRAQPRSVSDEEPELSIGRTATMHSAGNRSSLLLTRAEELAAQGRTEDAATVRFLVGRPLPRPLPQYLINLLGQELLDLLDQPELPIPQARDRHAK